MKKASENMKIKGLGLALGMSVASLIAPPISSANLTIIGTGMPDALAKLQTRVNVRETIDSGASAGQVLSMYAPKSAAQWKSADNQMTYILDKKEGEVVRDRDELVELASSSFGKKIQAAILDDESHTLNFEYDGDGQKLIAAMKNTNIGYIVPEAEPISYSNIASKDEIDEIFNDNVTTAVSQQLINATTTTLEDDNGTQTKGSLLERLGFDSSKGKTIPTNSVPKSDITFPSSYNFAINQNEVFDTVTLEKDDNGTYTGNVKIEFDGDNSTQTTILNGKFVYAMLDAFGGAGILNNKTEITPTKQNQTYMGLLACMDDNTTKINGAEEFVSYLAESQQITPLGSPDLAVLMDNIALTKYMVTQAQIHMSDNGTIVYNEEEFTKLNESYRSFANQASGIEKFITFTHPVGILQYVMNGFSYDKNDNITRHFRLNYKPNSFVFKDAMKKDGLTSEIMKERLEQNILTYESNLGGEE